MKRRNAVALILIAIPLLVLGIVIYQLYLFDRPYFYFVIRYLGVFTLLAMFISGLILIE